MAMGPEKPEIDINGLELIIEESKQKVVQYLIKEKEKIVETGYNEVKNILAKAYQDSEQLIAKSQEEAKQNINQAKEQADQDAENLLSQAQQKAEQVIRDADEEAARTLQKANDDANNKAGEVIRAAEQIKQRAVNEFEQSQKEAEKEASQILMKARQQAEEILNEAKEQVKVNFEDSNRLMGEIQQKMLQVVEAAGLDIKKSNRSFEEELKPDSYSEIHPTTVPTPALDENQVTEETESEPAQVSTSAPNSQNIADVDGNKETNPISSDEKENRYQGKMRIDIVPPVDEGQLSQLEKDLRRTPNLLVITKNISEDGGGWIDIELPEPLPLLNILRNLPDVRDVVGAKTYIIISMKSKQRVK